MITWMQKHRKYLVITIWVSTIAFVGAGFVGWGAYDFNNDRSGAVAKVGDRKISIKEFQQAYSNFYGYYNNMMGGKLDQETANKLKLDELTLSNLINQTLLLSYADEIGLTVLEEEVQQAIVDDESFQVGGKFNKDRYFESLKGARLQPSEFEASLKKQILIKKVSELLTIKPTTLEMEMMTAATFMKDKLKISIIESNEPVNVSEADLKAYHEQNKESFMTELTYNLDIIELAVAKTEVDDKELQTFFEENKHNYKDSEGRLLGFVDAGDKAVVDFQKKITKKEALKSYLDFKKGNIDKQSSLSITQASDLYDPEKFAELSIGDVAKPIELEDKFVICKLTSIEQPKPKSFEDARAQISAIVTQAKQDEQLANLAKNRLAMFEGETTEFLSRDDVAKVPMLSPEESAEFLNEVFSSNEKSGYKIFNNKAVLYEILEQQLLDTNKLDSYKDLLSENIIKLKDAELNQNLVKVLEGRYEVHRYYKGR
jgi:peptidyl-prolyl cis-trans isomerase D